MSWTISSISGTSLKPPSRGRAVPGDFKAHVTALHDSRIETEARRIVDKLKDLSAPNSPNKTHFMVEISPHFDALASTKDNDRLFAMLPYKSLCFTSIKDRHGIDEQTTQHLCEIFQTCCLFDLRFWDMVYAMGET